jgi:hypothetical protein
MNDVTQKKSNLPGLRMQLIFRRTWRRQVTERVDPQGFFIWRSGLGPLIHMRALMKLWGLKGFLMTVAKLCTPSRLLYGVKRGGAIVHTGWITLGRCRYYEVEPDAVVIGPVATAREWRGQGLAPAAACSAMTILAENSERICYIDTSDDNVASQRMIAKCGFGPHVSSYVKGPR